jgi:hypothetical protein
MINSRAVIGEPVRKNPGSLEFEAQLFVNLSSTTNLLNRHQVALLDAQKPQEVKELKTMCPIRQGTKCTPILRFLEKEKPVTWEGMVRLRLKTH